MTPLISAALQSFVPMWWYKHQDSCCGPVPLPAAAHTLTVQQRHRADPTEPSPAPQQMKL